MRNTEVQVKQIIAGLLGFKDEIANDMTIEDFKVDSLDAVELILTFEEEFDCVIPDEDVSYKMSIQQIIDYINTRK